jgi:uncharacterized protein YdiU (UPF0061 family)
VEAVIRAPIVDDDFAPFREMLAALSHPFDGKDPAWASYADPPPESDRAYRTFCGT